MKTLKLSAALLALAAPAVAQEETNVAMEEVPPAVMEVANAQKLGAADFTAVAMDEGVYEFSGTMDDGMGYEIDVTEAGSVEEVEKEIALDALPEPVAAALEAELAGFVPDYVEESTRAGGAVVYEFEGTHEGAAIDAEIAADGTGFIMNEDTAG